MAHISFDCVIEILLINFSGSHLIIQIKIQRKAKRVIMSPSGAGGGCETTMLARSSLWLLTGRHQLEGPDCVPRVRAAAPAVARGGLPKGGPLIRVWSVPLAGLMEGLRRGLLRGPSEGAEHRGGCRVRVIGNCSLSWLYLFF